MRPLYAVVVGAMGLAPVAAGWGGLLETSSGANSGSSGGRSGYS
jgi:hypothetical protein